MTTMINIFADLIILVITTILCLIFGFLNGFTVEGVGMAIIPLLVALIFSMITEYESRCRVRKILALKDMFAIVNYLKAAAEESIGINLFRKSRAPYIPPINIAAQRREIMSRYDVAINKFFKEFGLTKKKQAMLIEWETTPAKMYEILSNCKTKLKMNEFEELLFKQTK